MKRLRNNVEKRITVLNSLIVLARKHAKKLTLFSKVCFIALVLIISYIAFLPNYEKLPEFTSLSDVLNHFMAFFVLSILLHFGFSPRFKQAFVLLFAYGFFIEAVQHFLPNRHFDLMDLVVDMLGVSTYYFLQKSLKRSRI